MAGIFARLISPLRQIDADPDQLVVDAHRLIQEADKEKREGRWPLVTAYTGLASAKIQLAPYLKEHRD